MTYREWLKKNKPYNLHSNYIGGCFGCPGNYIAGAPKIHEHNCTKKLFGDTLEDCCTVCWNLELTPEQKAQPAPTKPAEPAEEDKPRKIVFLSGPITGVEKYWEAFEKAMDELSGRYIVLNPAQLPQGMTNDKYTRICLAMIDSADAVFMLPGWEMSKGAILEAQYCEYIKKPWTSSKSRLEEVLR